MNPFKKIPLLFIPAVFFAAGMFFSCENDLEKVKKVTASDDTPDEIVTNLHTLYSDSGQVKFELIASRMERFSEPEDKQLFKNGFEVNFYRNDTNKIASLKAEYGELSDVKKSFFARNNVTFTNYEKGQTLHTEELFWDQAAKRIRTEKFFRIDGNDGYWAEGYGMETDELFQDYIMHKVTASYNKNENGSN